MRKPGTARQAASTFAVSLLLLILGCELGSGLDENALVGSWTARSVQKNGAELFGTTDISFALIMRSDGTFSESVIGDVDHVVCLGEGVTTCTRHGTYEYDQDFLSFCAPECDGGMQYLIEGNTITYILVGDVVFSVAPPDAPPDLLLHVLPTGAITYVIVFQRI